MSNIDKYETRKKMVYDFMCDDMYVPMKIKELCIVLGVKKEDRPQLEQILLDLQAEGRITLSKRGRDFRITCSDRTPQGGKGCFRHRARHEAGSLHL